MAFFERTLVYSITVVLFSWAVVNQYLAIPLVGVAVFLNLGFLIWFTVASVYLLGDPLGMNVPFLNIVQPHVLLEWQVVMQDLFPWLLFGFLLLVARYLRTTKMPYQRMNLAITKDSLDPSQSSRPVRG